MDYLEMVLLLLILLLMLRPLAQKRRNKRQPMLLMSEGKVCFETLRQCRISVDELMRAARQSGCFNLADVDTALLEADGTFTFLPAAQKRLVTAKDFNFAPLREGVTYIACRDGKMDAEALQKTGFTERKLRDFLAAQGYVTEDVRLVLINESGRVAVFE